MGKQITFKNTQNQQFCQIQFDNDDRILISVAEGIVRIIKLKWGGLKNDRILYDFDINKLFYDSKYQQVIDYLKKTNGGGLEYSQESLKFGFNQLDVFRALLLKCNSIADLELILGKFNSSKISS